MKTIPEMAREAGAWSQLNKNSAVEYVMSHETLLRFAAIVRADGQNSLAELADKLSWADNKGVASAIRARAKP